MGLCFRTLERGMRNRVKMNFWSQATFKMNTFRLGYLLFSDCALNINPTSEELVEIAKTTEESFKMFFDI